MSEENTYLVKVIATNGPDKGKSIVIDLYDIADSIGFRNAAHLQSLKKVLRGGRADKSWRQDMEEAIKSLRRAIEREAALEADEPAKMPQDTHGVPCWGGVPHTPTWTSSESLKVGDRVTLNGKEVIIGPGFSILVEDALPTFEEWCDRNVPEWRNGGNVWYSPQYKDGFPRLPWLPEDVYLALDNATSDGLMIAYKGSEEAIGKLHKALLKLGKVKP